MTCRRVLRLGSVAAVAVMAVAVWLWWPRETAITLENGARIQPRMSLVDVEEILGGPERDETQRPTTIDETDLQAMLHFRLRAIGRFAHLHPDMPKVRTWQSDYAQIAVIFDPTDRVLDSFAMRVHPVQESPIHALRRWLRLKR